MTTDAQVTREGKERPAARGSRSNRATRGGATNPAILMLDIDGVLCLNDPYGLFELEKVIQRGLELPDFYELLFSPRAVAALNALLAKYQPLVVISSSWARYVDMSDLADTFEKAGIKGLRLHDRWRLTTGRTLAERLTRLASISEWLADNHEGEPFVILDDLASGIGLPGSELQASGRVVLCDYKVGLCDEHHDAIGRALREPVNLCPWMLANAIPPIDASNGIPVVR